MLYVQLDAGVSEAAERAPPEPALALLRARRIGDVLDGLELRAAEPAIMILRCAVVLALGPEAIASRTWTDRGLDAARGFALAMGPRDADARFPVGVAAFAARPDPLRAWLTAEGVAARSLSSDLIGAGDPALAGLAGAAAHVPWPATLASDDPYLDLLVRFGHARPVGGLWAAATRRGARFQVEMVARLPGLPPLHVIARDPPEGASEILPPGHEAPVALRRAAFEAPPAPAAGQGPPSWDEPGPCDCGVPPDLCAMKRFRLAPADGAAPSTAPGADILRQLSAAIVDLHEVRASSVPGLLPGDRVLVARSPESIATLAPGDAVLDGSGLASAHGSGGGAVAGGVLAVVPWPAIGREGAFRRTFSGLFVE